MKPLRIVSLGAENIKRLKAVHIEPKGSTVVISGKNDNGKTSVLDSIEYALAGKDHICEQPIRKGQERAHIICDLGEIVVERTFSAVSGDSTLRVRTADGKPAKSPQALLDSLCSNVAFDPLSFVRMRPEQQVETLRQLVGIDFTGLNNRRRVAFEQRTFVGRERDAAKARLAGMPFHPEASDVEANVGELMAKLTAAQEVNKKNSEVRSNFDHYQQLAEQAHGQLKAIDDEIQRLVAAVESAKVRRVGILERETMLCNRVKELEKEVSQLVSEDESPIKTEIQNITVNNSKRDANRRHQEQNAAYQAKCFEYDKLTAEIESIDQEKRDQLEFTEFPLPGLSMDDGQVLLNGVPFSQGSQARQLQAAVAIGLALNPRVRVILIRDGSLLDQDSLKLIGEMAEKHDAQIWIEIVQSNDPSAVVIEDGEVKPI